MKKILSLTIRGSFIFGIGILHAEGILVPIVKGEKALEVNIQSVAVQIRCYKKVKYGGFYGGPNSSGLKMITIPFQKKSDGTWVRKNEPEMSKEIASWRGQKFAQCDTMLDVEVAVVGHGTKKTGMVLENLENFRFSEGISGYMQRLEGGVIDERLKVYDLILVPHGTGPACNPRFNYKG